jgi:hypothetical protein
LVLGYEINAEIDHYISETVENSLELLCEKLALEIEQDLPLLEAFRTLSFTPLKEKIKERFKSHPYLEEKLHQYGEDFLDYLIYSKGN